MIKREDEMIGEVRRGMRGGQGEVEILHVFRQEELQGRCRLFARLRLAQGCSIGLHPHEKDEEVFYILRGEARVMDGDQARVLRPGDAMLTGGGASHSIENAQAEPLEVLAVILLVE